jgi:hypothetical protein
MLKCKYCSKTYPSNQKETLVNFEKYKQEIAHWLMCEGNLFYVEGIGVVCCECYDKHIKDKYIEASFEKKI